MKLKWYLCTLLIIFTFFGVFQENNIAIHNQEIVLEFVNLKLNKKDIECTVTNVKEKLLTSGATNITVQKTKNGALKISYFSVVNVSNIKELLSKDISLTDNNQQKNKEDNYPFSNSLSNYNFDIYELGNDTDVSNFDGNSILEIKYDSQRYTITQNLASLNNDLLKESHQLFKTRYKLNKGLVIVNENTSYLKPEVRAGPLSYFL